MFVLFACVQKKRTRVMVVSIGPSHGAAVMLLRALSEVCILAAHYQLPTYVLP